MKVLKGMISLRKFEGVLFCTDLDGTLYSGDKTISKENLDAIEYFKSEGGLFTFITGRVPQVSKEICEIINPNAPYGCVNGAGIYSAEEDKYLWNMSLPDSAVDLVKEVDEKLPEIGIQFNTRDQILFKKFNNAMEYFRKVTGCPDLRCNYEDLEEPILKVVLAHEDEAQILALVKFLNEHPKARLYDFIRSERRFYEILPKGASKGGLLKKLSELLGINPARTIAVGDYNNDVSMIKEAGLGFAVSNAVKEAKDAADYITVSNNESAIAAIIHGIDCGKFKI